MKILPSPTSKNVLEPVLSLRRQGLDPVRLRYLKVPYLLPVLLKVPTVRLRCYYTWQLEAT